MAQIVVEYRTITCEQNDNMADFWYEWDNKEFYSSIEDAIQNSDIIEDWRSGPTDLTVVRLHDRATGKRTYVAPHVFVHN